MATETRIQLLLASTSPYRRDMLARLGLPFRCVAPEVDESALADESPHALAPRLAASKARAVAGAHRGALIVGSDQVAELDGRILGKPGTASAARAQLEAGSGRSMVFHTAVCVLDTRCHPHRLHEASDRTCVQFRTLDSAAIERYVAAEQPLDCAGSFKAEGLGITLFEQIESNDPTALIGLPLIALSRLLRDAGLVLP